MQDWLELLIADIKVTIDNLRPMHGLVPALIMIWLFLLALPLSESERSCKLTGAAYVMALIATAIALILAIPGHLNKLIDAPFQLVFAGGIGLLCALRWYKLPDDNITIRRSDEKKDK